MYYVFIVCLFVFGGVVFCMVCYVCYLKLILSLGGMNYVLCGMVVDFILDLCWILRGMYIGKGVCGIFVSVVCWSWLVVDFVSICYCCGCFFGFFYFI